MTRSLSVLVSAFLAAVVAAAPVSPVAGSPDATKAADAERLVQQLGATRHADREAASKALDALGPAALPALREALKNSDPEIRRRAGDLLAKVERQAESAAALAPTKVRLHADNAPLAEVVHDLGRQANVRILLAREPVALAGRRVTLDIGESGFWDALDALCRTAKVSIRPGTLDPAGDEPAAGQVVQRQIINANGLPGAAPGMVVFQPANVVVSAAGPTEEPLVLHDGVAAECPTAILGAVRVRLIADRWVNRDRAPGDEVRWTLELLTEPRMRWLGRPSFRFAAPAGWRIDATPQLEAAAGGPAPGRVAVANANFVPGVTGPALNARIHGVFRQELPVYVKAAGAAAELKGTLTGIVQATVGTLATIPDVTKDKPVVTTRDGTRVAVQTCDRTDNGIVTLKVEVERPTGAMFAGNVVAVRPVPARVAAPGGAIPPQVARLLAMPEGTVEAVKLADDAGRPYEVAVTQTQMAQRNGVIGATLTLECRPPAATAKPRALELVGPRQIGVEAAFALRGVAVQ
jgi:hypothetical protein